MRADAGERARKIVGRFEVLKRAMKMRRVSRIRNDFISSRLRLFNLTDHLAGV